jgi:hypothetical protein
VVEHGLFVRTAFLAVHPEMIAALLSRGLKLCRLSDDMDVGTGLVFQLQEGDIVPCCFGHEHVECFTAVAEWSGWV